MFRYIFLVSRLASFILDYILFYALTFALSQYGVWIYLAVLAIFFLYRYLMTAYFGATLGMMVLKLKLKRYGFRICLMREIYRFASSFFLIGYIYAIFDRHSRALHDIMAQTYVVYHEKKETKDTVNKSRNKYLVIAADVLAAIVILRWTSYFVLNDLGLAGLRRAYVSGEYYQNFNGDNLISMSQDELYMKTLGRKYIASVDIGGKLSIVRISNKQKYTEVYKLNIINRKMIGQYIYSINVPIQFISSGNFAGRKDLCGVSPQNDIVFVNGSGKVYARDRIKLSNVVALMCGDIDSNGFDEAAVLNSDGDIEIFRYSGNKLSRIYSGKIGEDILPETFYIDKGIVVFAKADNKTALYFYTFKDNAFQFRDEKMSKISEASTVSGFEGNLMISYVNRGSMMFQRGRIQSLEVYSIKDKVRRIYNFGSRPGRRYAYLVRTLEEIEDVDGDGKKEVVMKAVGKDDVMGQGYIIEVYKPVKPLLAVNRILTVIEGILF